jgi:sigma-B regulation protein RsbU (phosphoserine phosphatase)
VKSGDQLGRLGASFNGMASSIERLIVEREEKNKLQAELALARQVQESLCPARLPSIGGARLAAQWIPARNISGDFYDVFEISEDRLGILCADVSGKGISAALLAASIQAAMRAALHRNASYSDPARLIEEVNTEICRRIPENRFITVFFAIFEPSSRRLLAVNAGHCPALLLHTGGGAASKLQTGGVPVGMFHDSRYQYEEIFLEAGSTLVAYTDGLPEAENANGEEFGEERLEKLCRLHAAAEPEQMVNEVLKECSRWAGAAPQHDDVTLLVLRAA